MDEDLDEYEDDDERIKNEDTVRVWMRIWVRIQAQRMIQIVLCHACFGPLKGPASSASRGHRLRSGGSLHNSVYLQPQAAIACDHAPDVLAPSAPDLGAVRDPDLLDAMHAPTMTALAPGADEG